jgi:hypothetical protein
MTDPRPGRRAAFRSRTMAGVDFGTRVAALRPLPGLSGALEIIALVFWDRFLVDPSATAARLRSPGR